MKPKYKIKEETKSYFYSSQNSIRTETYFYPLIKTFWTWKFMYDDDESLIRFRKYEDAVNFIKEYDSIQKTKYHHLDV